MYLSHEQFDQALASPPGEGARSLPGANAPGSGPEVAAARSPRAWAASLRLALETRISGWDIAPDLAEDIGSRRWFRGLGTLAGLGLAALALWPDFSPVEAATATPPDAAIRDQFRVHAIAPLRAGARTGIRMAPGDAVVPLAGVPERPSVRMVATLAAGDSFGRMLERAGVGPADAARAAALVAAVLPPAAIEPGTQFAITMGRRAAAGEARSLDRLTFRARFDLDLAITRDDAGLTVSRRPIAVDATPLRITGTVGSSLYRSARAAGAPARAIQQYLQAIDAHVGLDEGIAPDDTFDLVLAYRRSAGGEARAGDLIYAGLEHGGKPRVQLLRWGKEGRFVAAPGSGQAEGISVGGSFSPVAGRLTSRFGMRRHPILGYVRMHSGVDFGAGWGSPIFAASDGIVSFAGWHGGHGKYVRLEHGGSLGTGYAHMSRIAVSPGMRVSGGQVIGYVGSSGLSTGPHLHYEAYLNGRKVDPLSISFSAVRTALPVDTGERDEFAKRLAAIRAIEPGKALQRLGPR